MINVREVNQITQELHESWVISDTLSTLRKNVLLMSRASRGYLLEQNPTSLEEYNRAKTDYLEVMKELDDLVVNEEQRKNLTALQAPLREMVAFNDDLMSLVNANRVGEAVQAWRQDGGEVTQFSEEIDLIFTMQELEKEVVARDEARQADALQRLQRVVLIAATLSVILSVLTGTWIVLKASRTMNQAAGDIASSASEIAASIEQQERTSSQQAASVNETSTTMDELGASSRQSAEQAEAAASGAQQALVLAEGGTRAVERSLDGMTALREKVDSIADQILRLSEQTSQIGGISGLVSDLANQTNMLALNAAVEAVRAGEHGKGFAVVSGEIRKLADQSKKSAEKINALVADIQTAINSTVMVTDEGTKKVEEGVKIAEETADAFAGVADAVNNVVLNGQQISLNVKQQAVAIQQVVSAMSSLSTGAQENANGISQIKIGTHRLNESAMLLKVAI